MKLLPKDNFTISTDAPHSVVLSRLNARVEPPKMVRWSRNHKPYEGRVDEDSFKISRIIDYRNSFLPIIRGKFEPQGNGTAIHITMSLHPFVIGFLGFWFFSWYGGVIPVILFNINSIPILMAIVFTGMPLVMLVVFWFAFWTEARKSREELTQILLGK